MNSFIKFISFYIGKRNLNYKKAGFINLLDIGCSSTIPDHFLKYSTIINIFGCDPDLVGIKKLKKQKYLDNFKSFIFKNVGASDESKKSFLEIADKRTGSKIRENKNNLQNVIEIDLIKTSILQNKFSDGSANIIKIDAEGHELEVIKGIDFDSEDLLCVEVECSLQDNDKLSYIFSLLERNNFFISTFRYHNQQTLYVSKFKNKLFILIYKILRKIPLIKNFNSLWTDLSGNSSFSRNKSFISQIEFVFLKKESFVKQSYKIKYQNILIIYGFLRHIKNLKGSKFLNFIVKNFPSR